MGPQKKRPNLDPVLENSVGPPITFTGQAVSTQLYKPHKYGSRSKVESQCTCLSPLSFLVKLRDRYIRSMNEMAIRGGDFTAVSGYHAWAEFDYTLQQCKSVNERHLEG